MRKFSKILAALLTVCLLCGVVVSFVASADDEQAPKLEYATGIGTGSAVQVGGNSNSTYGNGISKDTSEGYLRITHSLKNAPTLNSSPASGAWTAAGGTINVYNKSGWLQGVVNTHDHLGMKDDAELITYMTVDFDFAITGYRYFILDESNDVVVTTREENIEGLTEVSSKEAVGKGTYYKELAVPDNYYARFEIYRNGKETNFGQHYLVKDTDGLYYVTDNTTKKSANYWEPLANEVGVADHFTYVVRTTANANGTFTLDGFFYLNGEYVTKVMTLTVNSAETPFSFKRFYYAFDKAQNFKSYDSGTVDSKGNKIYWYSEFEWLDNFDIGYMNFATNYYTAEDLEKTNLDDKFGAGVPDTLYGINNVVCNEFYQVPGSNGYVEYKGQKYYFPKLVLAEIEASLKTGESFITAVDIEEFNPKGAASFFVKCLDGATVKLDNYDKFSTVGTEWEGYDLYIINETTISGKDRLNVTGDVENRYNDFSNTSTDVTGNLGANTTNDGDYEMGAAHDYSCGYFRIYGTGGQIKNTANGALKAWTLSHNASVLANNFRSNYFDTSFAVMDFEFGADKYVFTYTADVERTVDFSGSSAPADKTESLEGATLYMLVDSYEEYLKYLNNPSKLNNAEGLVTTQRKDGSWSYVQTDIISNAQVVEGSFTVALGLGYDGATCLSTNLLYAANTNAGTKASRSDNNPLGAYLVQDTGSGLWYFSNKTAYTADGNNVLLSNKVGVTDHVSVVIDNGILNEGYISYTVYVNGQFLSTGKFDNGKGLFSTSKCAYLSSRGVGVFIKNPYKAYNNYSIKIDDLAFNWYRTVTEYDTETTTDAYTGVKSWSAYVPKAGVEFSLWDLYDDLKAGVHTSIELCDDVFYNKSTPRSSGWVTVDGGETVLFSDADIREALLNIENGASVITSRNISLTEIGEGIDEVYFTLIRDGYVTVTESVTETHVFEEYLDGVYRLRKFFADEIQHVIFKDIYGNVYYTATIRANQLLSCPNYNINLFDTKTGVVTGFDKWVFEGTETSPEGYYFTGKSTGEDLVVVPVTKELATLNTFAVYKYDVRGNAVLVGAVEDYATLSASAMLDAVAKIAEDGCVLVLLYDGEFDLGGGNEFQVRYDFTFDLNGRTLLHSKDYSGGGYGAYMFEIYKGVTFNLISSKAGGAIYQARFNGTQAQYANQAWANGIIGTGVGAGADMTINVGAYDANGNVCKDNMNNLGIYGGSLVFVDGGTKASANGSDININVRGAEFYHALRSGYAVFVTRNDVVNINLYDSQFYSNSSKSYGVTYDYYSSSYPHTVSHVKAYGCEFYATLGAQGIDDRGSWRPIFSNGSNSTIYLEDCKAIGSCSISGKLTLGKGNMLSLANVDMKKVAVADGVTNMALDSSIYISGSFTHPEMYFFAGLGVNGATTLIPDGKGGMVLNPDVLDKDNWVTTTTARNNVYVTYETGKDAPKYETATVEYCGVIGSGKVINTYTYIVGEKIGEIFMETGHVGYKVNNLSFVLADGETEAYGTVVEGDTKIYAYDWDVVVTGFTGLQANLTLKTDMKFNLYIPYKAGTVITGVSNGTLLPTTVTVGGTEYNVIVIDLPAGSFDAFTIDVYFKGTNLTYNTTFELTDTITIDYVTSYLTKALASAKCGSDVAILLNEILDYNVAVAKYIDASFDETAVACIAEFRAKMAAHNVADDPETEDVDESKVCTCQVKLPEAGAIDLSALAGSVADVNFYLSEENIGDMGLIIKLNAGVDASTVSVSYVDVNGNTVVANVEYNEEGNYVAVKDIKAAYIDNTMTITVGTASGTCSLGAYVASLGENAPAVANALLEYAAAAEAYKVSIK